MITDEHTSTVDGVRSLGFEETGAYRSYCVFSLPGLRGVVCVDEKGSLFTGLKASKVADSSESSFAHHVLCASALPRLDPAAVQAFKEEVVQHSSSFGRLVTIPDGYAYGFTSGFGLAICFLLLAVLDYGYSALPVVAIVAIAAGLVGGQYRVREMARESMYRRDDNRQYEKIKRIEAAVARIRPEGMIEEFVER